MKIGRISMCLTILLIGASLIDGQTERARSETDSARSFAQGFYTWYARLANQESSEPPYSIAIRERKAAFSDELILGLQIEIAAENAEIGYANGLDFDPFLGTQDPSDRYDVAKVTQKAGHYFAELYGTRNGKRSDTAEVIVEIAILRTGPKIINFYYPRIGGNLLQSLAMFRVDRSNAKRK